MSYAILPSTLPKAPAGPRGSLPRTPLFGKVFRGDAMTQDGDFAEGTVQMREGISELRSMGTLFSLLGFLPASLTHLLVAEMLMTA